MYKGDISNAQTARLVVVWEGLLAIETPVEEPARKRRPFRKPLPETPETLIRNYQINESMARVIWDAVWRRSLSVDVVTFLGADWVDPISVWVDEHGLPTGHVTASTRPRLARELAYRPDVFAVYDPEPRSQLIFGSKGRYLDPEHPQTFGAM